MNENQLKIQLSYREKCKQLDLALTAAQLKNKDLGAELWKTKGEAKAALKAAKTAQGKVDNLNLQLEQYKEKVKDLKNKLSEVRQKAHDNKEQAVKDEYLEYKKSQDREKIIKQIELIKKRCKNTINENIELKKKNTDYAIRFDKIISKGLPIILNLIRDYLINAYNSRHLFAVQPSVVDDDVKIIEQTLMDIINGNNE